MVVAVVQPTPPLFCPLLHRRLRYAPAARRQSGAAAPERWLRFCVTLTYPPPPPPLPRREQPPHAKCSREKWGQLPLPFLRKKMGEESNGAEECSCGGFYHRSRRRQPSQQKQLQRWGPASALWGLISRTRRSPPPPRHHHFRFRPQQLTVVVVVVVVLELQQRKAQHSIDQPSPRRSSPLCFHPLLLLVKQWRKGRIIHQPAQEEVKRRKIKRSSQMTLKRRATSAFPSAPSATCREFCGRLRVRWI